MTVVVEAVGLAEFKKYLAIAPDIATTSARVAINQTAQRKGLKLAQDAILSQVAFPRGYLSERVNGTPRFRVASWATDERLESDIRGIQNPTPLARFSRDRPAFERTGRRRGGRPIRVRVNAEGAGDELRRAFFIRLRSGNIGLGIRLNGETLTNTTGAKLITSGPLRGVSLLYGPSVDQVFRSVAVDISPPVLDELTREFFRQFEFRFSRANLTAT